MNYFTQETHDRVRFIMVAPDLRGDDQAKLQHLVRAAMGPCVAVEFEQVNQIRQMPAGKLQVVINRIAPQGEAA